MDSLVRMKSADPTETLNRVLAILRRSFVQYLRWGRPYIPLGREQAMDTITDIGLAQDLLADRIAEMIDQSGATPDVGDYPMEFTDTHDLAIDFLIEEAIGYQKQDIAALERCVAELAASPAAQSLASEALGLARGHLESLEGLKPQPGASTIIRNGAPARDND